MSHKPSAFTIIRLIVAAVICYMLAAGFHQSNTLLFGIFVLSGVAFEIGFWSQVLKRVFPDPVNPWESSSEPEQNS